MDRSDRHAHLCSRILCPLLMILAGMACSFTLALAQSPVNLTPWTQEGETAGPNWNLAADGLSVLQTVNTPVPTFYVSPDEFIDTTIRGSFGVQTTSDDDFIGFVFGYAAPHAANEDNPRYNDFILFDWKQLTQLGASAGFRLAKVLGTHNNGSHNNNQFWNHVSDENISFIELATPLVNAGWADNTLYDFELVYQPDRITISLQGGSGVFESGVTIFDVLIDDLPEGTFVNDEFPAGAFGFYNLSQETVRYQNFTQEGQPVLQTTPANDNTMDFGHLRHGTSSQQDLTITNIGGIGSNLEGTISTAAAPFSGPSPDADFLLQLDDTDIKTFSFSPTTRGSAAENVDVDSNGGSATITLSGHGVGPVYQSSTEPDETINLGLVAATNSADTVLTIANISPDAPGSDALVGLTLSGAAITGTDEDRFELLNFTADQVISKGDDFELQIRFSPGGESGPAEALLTINTDVDAVFGGEGTTFTYPLAGVAGFEVNASVTGGQGDVTPTSQIVAAGDDAEFIIVPEPGWEIDSVIGDPCSPQFDAGQTWIASSIDQNCQVSVVFAALPELVLEPPELTFVDPAVDPPQWLASVSIGNDGIGDLEIGTLQIQGAAASEFTIVPSGDHCTGQTLATTQSCTFQIEFDPLLDGRRDASVLIDSNAPDQPHELLLHAVTDPLFRDRFEAEPSP